MHNIIFENKSNQKIDNSLKKQLSELFSKWQEKNNYPVFILIKQPESDKLFSFRFKKDVWELLEKGVSHNLLEADIDSLFKNYKETLKSKVQFIFYIGFTKEEIIKKKTDEKGYGKKEERVLNVSPIEPKYSLSQIVLQEGVKQEIYNVLALLKNMRKIYEDWGFGEIDPVPRSVVNLWGPPGTGKTMTVHAIAKDLGKKILVLNYADIESKYVGEAPKNLIAAFDMAEKEDAVIFFDEADSFLGKRITNVDSGSEQAINSLRSQMLMKLEEFNGIVFFATNLHENYDRAFESRILKHIEFKLPDIEARKEIIKSKLPLKAPYALEVKSEEDIFDDELLTKMAKSIDGFSGREIKNCILELLVQASQEEHPLITAEIMMNVFAAKKAEADALKKKEQERKERIAGQIQNNLKTKNYKIKKLNKRRK